MATAIVREYDGIDVQSPVEPGVTTQAITTSGTSAQSAAFDGRTMLIAISTPAAQAVAVQFGSNPTATTSHLRLPANSLFFFRVSPGHKVAMIDVA